jgi:hypothetical protein
MLAFFNRHIGCALIVGAMVSTALPAIAPARTTKSLA